MSYKGKLIILSGPMYAGKSRYLIMQFNYLRNTVENFDKKFKTFKPKVDIRNKNIESRSGIKMNSTFVDKFSDINEQISDDIKYLFVDEFQFFSMDFTKDLKKLLNKGVNIYLSGLDKDFTGTNFKRYVEVKEMMNQEIKLTAVCHKCGNIAKFSIIETNQELLNENIIVDVSDDVQYYSACGKCHTS